MRYLLVAALMACAWPVIGGPSIADQERFELAELKSSLAGSKCDLGDDFYFRVTPEGEWYATGARSPEPSAYDSGSVRAIGKSVVFRWRMHLQGKKTTYVVVADCFGSAAWFFGEKKMFSFVKGTPGYEAIQTACKAAGVVREAAPAYSPQTKVDLY